MQFTRNREGVEGAGGRQAADDTPRQQTAEQGSGDDHEDEVNDGVPETEHRVIGNTFVDTLSDTGESSGNHGELRSSLAIGDGEQAQLHRQSLDETRDEGPGSPLTAKGGLNGCSEDLREKGSAGFADDEAGDEGG